MEIIEDKQNSLLKRKEVKVIVEAEKNPTMQEAAKMIAGEFKSDEENIAVKLVKGRFGRSTFLVVANIYKSKEDKDKIEPAVKKKGKGGEEKKPAGSTEEKPAEQIEQKPEEKQEEDKQ